MADITDGTSVAPTWQAKNSRPRSGLYRHRLGADDQSAYAGDCDDQCRWTGQDTATTVVTNQPLPDTPGNGNWSIFGKRDLNGFQMALLTVRFT